MNEVEWNEAERLRLKFYIRDKLSQQQGDSFKRRYLAHAKMIIAKYKFKKKNRAIGKKVLYCSATVSSVLADYDRQTRRKLRAVYLNKMVMPSVSSGLVTLKPFNVDPKANQCPRCFKPFRWVHWGTETTKNELELSDTKTITTSTVRTEKISCLCLKPGWLEQQAQLKAERLERILRIKTLKETFEVITNQSKNLSFEFMDFKSKLLKKYPGGIHCWEDMQEQEASVYKAYLKSADDITAVRTKLVNDLRELGEYVYL